MLLVDIHLAYIGPHNSALRHLPLIQSVSGPNNTIIGLIALREQTSKISPFLLAVHFPPNSTYVFGLYAEVGKNRFEICCTFAPTWPKRQR